MRQTIEKALRIAKESDKPNFTQLQLVLNAENATPEDYYRLRLCLEQKYNLQPFDSIVLTEQKK